MASDPPSERAPHGGGGAGGAGGGVRGVRLLGSFLLSGLLADLRLGHAWSLALRIALAPLALLGLLALGLVTNDDLEKFAAIPLRWEPLRQVRDPLVTWTRRLVHALAPGEGA